MPQLMIEGHKTVEVAPGTRLVLAVEAGGMDILHRCGGYGKCTTCRVEFTAGEPDTMTVAERDKLAEQNLLGTVRLSCQILCDRDMAVRPLMTVTSTNLPDPGPAPEEHITPEPEWTTKTS
ncbi:MAG: (2Fe-2S)-binding protein [Blastochloris sp.]|nr:(2Fe-2S)-binding protein [Blastochloris sp.]